MIFDSGQIGAYGFLRSGACFRKSHHHLNAGLPKILGDIILRLLLVKMILSPLHCFAGTTRYLLK